MNKKARQLVIRFVEENIDSFHSARIKSLAGIDLDDLLKKKNPYLFRAKNLNLAPNLVSALLEALLSSSEEGCFGGFLERLAIYVAEISGGGLKSAAKGIDIELVRGNTRYLIAVKSGRNWGNSAQHAQLRANFKTAVRVIRQVKRSSNLQPTLGICYGKFKTKNTGEYLHIGGQSFWHLLSGDKQLYVDLVEPLGHRAEEHDAAFQKAKDDNFNRLIREFTNKYCDRAGAIDWPRLVEFVSGNMPA